MAIKDTNNSNNFVSRCAKSLFTANVLTGPSQFGDKRRHLATLPVSTLGRVYTDSLFTQPLLSSFFFEEKWYFLFFPLFTFSAKGTLLTVAYGKAVVFPAFGKEISPLSR